MTSDRFVDRFDEQQYLLHKEAADELQAQHTALLMKYERSYSELTAQYTALLTALDALVAQMHDEAGRKHGQADQKWMNTSPEVRRDGDRLDAQADQLRVDAERIAAEIAKHREPQ